MKNRILTFLLTSMSTLICHAQQPQNPGFELWNSDTLFETPPPFATSSEQVYLTTGVGPGNVIRTTDKFHGTYAMKLTTVSANNDTISGFALIGTGGQGGLNGGIPYTGQPDSISFYVKYDIKPNDTAFVLFGFKKSGTIMAYAGTSFTGSQVAYKRVSVDATIPITPDSMIAVITCSRLEGAKIPGSTLTIDSITFIGTANGLANPSFETWNTVVSEEPASWFTINGFATGTPCVTKSTDKNNGNFAAQIETIIITGGDTLGLLTNGRLDNGIKGGMPVNGNPLKLSGYYKYTPVGPDTGLVGLTAFSGGIAMDSAIGNFTATATYTYFEVQLAYNNFPYIDTLAITFASSNLDQKGNYIGVGSKLYIDDLVLAYNPLGIHETPADKFASQVYPNPANESATIYCEYNFLSQAEIYDQTGRQLLTSEKGKGKFKLPTGDLSSGLYFYYVVESSTGNKVASGKLIVE